MKIQLDYKIDIEVKENNKSKEKLTVFYREFTQAEKKDQEALRKKFEKILHKAQKIEKKQNTLSKQAELYELNGDYERAIDAISKKELLDDELELLIDELEEFGGVNQDDFAESFAQERFEKLVSGKDKEKLESYAQIKGYAVLMRGLDQAKADLEKKLSGE